MTGLSATQDRARTIVLVLSPPLTRCRLPALSAFLILLAGISLGVCQFVVRRLAVESPSTYVELDRPDLFRHNTARAAVLFWRWLYSRRPGAQPMSRALQCAVWFLRVATPIYVLVFTWALLFLH